MSSTFKKTPENFVCQFCNTRVEGDGFTNHCPQCLWSKHVDIFPGDREELCQGLMEPVSIELKGKEYTIIHRCQGCGTKRKNKTSDRDNFSIILEIVRSGN